MVQRKCPYSKKRLCYDKGDCETCEWGKLITRYERKIAKLKKENEALKTQLKQSTPEKEAFWESQEEENDFLWTKCSNCGYETENYNAVTMGNSSTDYVDVKLPYCPECGCKMSVRHKCLHVDDYVKTTIKDRQPGFTREYEVYGWIDDVGKETIRITLQQDCLNGIQIAVSKVDVFFIDRRPREERKKTKLDELIENAVPAFQPGDYIEGLETIGVKDFDERTKFVRGWVNEVHGDWIDIQADDEYKGHRGTHIEFSTAKKIEPAKPRIVLL